MLVLVGALLLPAASARAQDPSDDPKMSVQQALEIAAVMDPFYTAVKNGEVGAAYTDLFAETLLASRTVELQQLVSQTTFILQTYGALQAWEAFDSRCPAPRLCKVQYLLHTDNGPVFVWVYPYRRSDGRWLVSNILVGDTVSFAF